jgi:hypothetical protein
MFLSKLIVVLNDWVTELMLWLVVIVAMVWGYNIGAELVAMNFGTFLPGDYIVKLLVESSHIGPFFEMAYDSYDGYF